ALPRAGRVATIPARSARSGVGLSTSNRPRWARPPFTPRRPLDDAPRAEPAEERGGPGMVRHARCALRRWVAVGLGVTVGAGLNGCVGRRYTIRTNPPGALVVVNGEEIGRTPVSRNFTYYGDRDINLMLDGYQTQRIIEPVPAPWYDNLL